MIVSKRPCFASVALFMCIALPTSASSETLFQTLVATFSDNPTLNAARAAQRAQNETVNQALSGRKPIISGTTSFGGLSQRSFTSGLSTSSDGVTSTSTITLQQNIFNGFQVANNVKSAEAGVRAGLHNLLNTEQIVLQLGVTAYSDVYRDRQILRLQEHDTQFSREQLRASKAQAEVGENTRTDVALAEANLADSLSDLAVAKSNLRASEATFLQVVGHQPEKLSPPTGAVKKLPSSLRKAIAIAMKEHPLINAAQNNVEAGEFNVKVSEGTLLPTITLDGAYQRDFLTGSVDSNSDTGTITANVTIPIYQGGIRFSNIRQAKETVGQLRIQVDETRRLIIQDVRATWAALISARSQIRSSRTNVRASQVALDGLVEQRKLGEATTLDVLNGQTNLITAQVALANAERDRIVASYAVLAAIGRFTGNQVQVAQVTNVSSPAFHYKVVRDKWVGLRTTSGN